MVHNDKYKFVAIVNEKIEMEKINPITKRLSLFK